jgi:hypothetical protein
VSRLLLPGRIPVARLIAVITLAVLALSSPVTVSRRATGMPPARLADNWRMRRSPPAAGTTSDSRSYVVAGATPVLVHNSGCGPSTFYHGSNVNSVIDILNNSLDASKAAASYTDGPGGFFMATKEGGAEFFAVRNGPGAVIKIRMSDSCDLPAPGCRRCDSGNSGWTEVADLRRPGVSRADIGI